MLDPQLRRTLEHLKADGLRVATDQEAEAVLPGLPRAVDAGYASDESAANDSFSVYRLTIKGELALSGVFNPTWRQLIKAFVNRMLHRPILPV